MSLCSYLCPTCKFILTVKLFVFPSLTGSVRLVAIRIPYIQLNPIECVLMRSSIVRFSLMFGMVPCVIGTLLVYSEYLVLVRPYAVDR